jgi:hypothetical protein
MSISAMKQASMQLNRDDVYLGHRSKTRADAITALRQALAEAEKQEAVAWMWKDGTLTSDPDFADGTWTPLFAAPVHASDMSEEHVHKSDKDTLIKQAEEAFESAKEKGWVGLTDEEVMLVMDDVLEGGGWLDIARAIEAKLKEKNT